MGSIVYSTDSIIAILDGVHPNKFGGDEVERLRVRAAARRLLARVESPYERAWGFCFEHPAVFAALQTCIDLGVWKAWTEVGGGKKTIHDLVALSGQGVDTNLLREFLSVCNKPYSDILQDACFACWRPLMLLKKQTKTRSSQHHSHTL